MDLKRLSPAIFGVIIICFFLPWVMISCNDYKIVTLTGIQLVTGTNVEVAEQRMFDLDPPEEQEAEREPLAFFVLLSAVAGLTLSFIRGKIGAIGTSLISVVGIVFILLLKAKLDNDILREGEGLLHIDYGFGFYLVLILFFSAFVINVYSMKDGKGISLPQVKMSGNKFCPECGAKNEKDNQFCTECGTEFS